jgi:GNAT superfamily N-acetyltransferase
MIKLKQLLHEITLDEKDMIVISKKDEVSISHKLPNSIRASVVNIDYHTSMGFWWVSRMLIGDEKLRRKGIGSFLLQKAVKEVLRHDPTAIIIVEPGGSYGTREDIQIKFYMKNGFIPLKNHKGALIYNNPNMKDWEYIDKLLKGIQ